MSRRSDQTPPVAFEPLRRNLEHWRQSRVPGRPMPDHLWKAAARLAREHGVSKTAFALRLDCYRLKERLEASRRKPRGSRGRDVPAFLEVPLGRVGSLFDLAREESRFDGRHRSTE